MQLWAIQGTLPKVNLAVVAAFTAAAISLVNVLITARLARGGQFRQWQREDAGPIIERVLVLSDELRLSWSGVAEDLKTLSRNLVSPRTNEYEAESADNYRDTLQTKIYELLLEGRDKFVDLSNGVSALQLISPPPTRNAASRLKDGHQSILTAFERYPLENELPDIIKKRAAIDSAEQDLADSFRTDLGVSRGRKWLR